MTTHHRLLPFVLAVTLLILTRPVVAAEPVTTAAAPLTVALELAFSGLSNEEQAELTALVQAEFETRSGAHGLQPVAEAQPDLVVRTDISRPEGQAAVHLITTIVEFEGEVIREVREAVCLRCTPVEVASESLSILPDAATQAREARAKAALPEPPPPTVAAADEPAGEARQRVLGPVGYVGIASTGLGLGAAITGAVLLHRGRVVASEPGALDIETVDHRPAGIALTGVGLGVMVVGNVLLAIDLSVLRHRRANGRAELTGVGATAEGGLVLAGRF